MITLLYHVDEGSVFLESLFTPSQTTRHYDIMTIVSITKPVKTSGYCMCHLVSRSKMVRSAYRMCLCLSCDQQKKVLFFPHTGHADWFRGASAKLRKTTLSIVTSVSPSIRPFPWNNSTPTRQIFMDFLCTFRKICRENSRFIKI